MGKDLNSVEVIAGNKVCWLALLCGESVLQSGVTGIDLNGSDFPRDKVA